MYKYANLNNIEIAFIEGDESTTFPNFTRLKKKHPSVTIEDIQPLVVDLAMG